MRWRSVWVQETHTVEHRRMQRMEAVKLIPTPLHILTPLPFNLHILSLFSLRFPRTPSLSSHVEKARLRMAHCGIFTSLPLFNYFLVGSVSQCFFSLSLSLSLALSLSLCSCCPVGVLQCKGWRRGRKVNVAQRKGEHLLSSSPAPSATLLLQIFLSRTDCYFRPKKRKKHDGHKLWRSQDSFWLFIFFYPHL